MTIKEAKAGSQRLLSSLGNAVKSLLRKMLVKTERSLDAKTSHSFKAHTIDQTQLFASCGKESACRGLMDGFINPMDMKKRDNIVTKHVDRSHSKTMLKKSKRFDQDMVVTKKFSLSED